MTLQFCRTKFVGYEWGSAKELKIYGTLEDTLYSMRVDIRVKLPELQITSLTGQMRRFTTPFCEASVKFLEKGAGLKLEQGFESQVKRLIARPGCRHFGNLIIECCDSILPALLCMKHKELQEEDPTVSLHAAFEEIQTRYPQLAQFCPIFATMRKGE